MDPRACCPLLLRHEVALDNFGFPLSTADLGISPTPGSSDEHVQGPFHPGRFVAVVFILLGLQVGVRLLLYAAPCFRQKLKPSPFVPKLDLGIGEICLIMAIWEACVTNQAGIYSATAGLWAETDWERSSRYPGSNNLKNLALSKQESNKQRQVEARAAKNQIHKLSVPLYADWVYAYTWHSCILVPGNYGIFYLTIGVVFYYFYFLVHQDLNGTWKRSAYIVGIALMCTLHNMYEARASPPTAQAGVSSDSESTTTRSYRETEPENNCGSDSRVAKHGDINAVAKTAATWLVASAATHHATGNRNLLSGFKTVYAGDPIQVGDGVPRTVRGHGYVISDSVVLPDVWFVPGLDGNIVSASQLIELDYSIVFTHGVCYIRGATDDTVIGKAPVGEDGMFQLEFLKVPLLN